MPDTVPPLKGRRLPNPAISSLTGNLMGCGIYLAEQLPVLQKLTPVIKNTLPAVIPELIGISAMSFLLRTARRIVSFIKNLDSTIKFVTGSCHGELMHKEIEEDEVPGPFDFILRGDNGLSFGEPVNALENKTAYRDVMGLSFSQDGVFVHNQPGSLEDLTKAALPERKNQIRQGYASGVKLLDIVETPRGCTIPCSFWSMTHKYGRKFRVYAIEWLRKEISDGKKPGLKYLVTADDAITQSGHNGIR